MQDSRLSSSLSDVNMPRNEEWAILNRYRALENEKARNVEKMLYQQKKEQFKNQLDQQLEYKHSVGRDEKAQDRKYYEQVVQKAQQMRDREERERFEKYVRRKQIEDENQHKPIPPSERQLDEGKVYNIEFGLKSELEKKQRAETIRLDVNNTLDRQLQEKRDRQRLEKQMNLSEQRKNEEYQSQMFANRNKGHKNYNQNPVVYNHYRDIYRQQAQRNRDLQHKLVDEVLERDRQQAQRRREREASEKAKRNIEMKDALEKQVQLHSKNQISQKTNPEQASYSFMNGVFKDHRRHHDKHEYSMFLDRQVEEQRRNKVQHKYMSEQEYRYNANQLNKALKGSYVHDRYHDRSLGTVGNRVSVADASLVQGGDADLIKTRLDQIRSHQRNVSALHHRSSSDLAL